MSLIISSRMYIAVFPDARNAVVQLWCGPWSVCTGERRPRPGGGEREAKKVNSTLECTGLSIQTRF